jgi:Bacterial protein of unknown function (DUF885)
MKKIILVAALSLPLAIAAANANPNDVEFEKIAKDYTENYLSSHPEFATELGDHRFDGILTDYSPETRARMLANAKQVREALGKFDDYKQLTGANQVDARILRDDVDSEIFRLEELREADWNPLVYNQSLANSLYLLVARDFDSAQKRIPNLRQRMVGIPNVIKQAEANLQHPPRVHTETAIEQIQGAINLVRNGLDPLLNQAPQLRKDLAPIQEKPPRRWRTTRNGCRKICSSAPMVISVLARRNFGRNCVLLWHPICRWRKSGSARTPIFSRPRPPSTRRRCRFTKNIFRRPTGKL